MVVEADMVKLQVLCGRGISLGQGNVTFSNQDHAIIKTEGITIKNN